MTTSAQSQPEHWLVVQWRRGLTAEQFRQAVTDIIQGWQRRSLWLTMGLQDIKHRYRRSTIGPFWLTISMGVMVGGLSWLYGGLFQQDLHDYLPFLTLGFIFWGLISSLILEGTTAFISSEGLIRQLAAPLSIYVYRVVWTNLIVLAHNIWIYVIVALWFGIAPGWGGLLVLPALLLIVLNGVWVGLLLGLLSARFRDIPQILASLVQVMFFMTPIIWSPTQLPGRALLLDLNPFYHFIEIVRAPLLGQAPALSAWVVAVLVTLVGWVVTLLFYMTYRWRIAYWV